MRKHRVMSRLAVLLASLGAAACTAAVIAAVSFCRGTVPVLLAAPEEATRCAEQLMTAICDGDFAEAETLLYGQPDLGADRIPEDPVEQMIWKAYLNSLDYELVGELYPSDTGLVQDVKFISLELDSVTANLDKRAQEGLNEAIAAAEEVSQLYDEDNEYRKDLVQEILQEATRAALEEDVRYTYQILPLQLICSHGQWYAVADKTWMNAVSGGITG